MDLRFGIRAGEYHPARGHTGDHLLGHLAGRESEEHVGTDERLSHSPGSALGIGPGGKLGLDVIEIATTGVHDALRIDHRDIGKSGGQQNVGARDARGTSAGNDHLQ